MAKRNSRVEDAEVDEEITGIDNTSNDDGVKKSQCYSCSEEAKENS